MAEDSEQAPQLPATAWDGFWNAIKNFDWLEIPGAVRAIARLVEGAGDAGAAWVDIATAKGHQASRAIRDTTEARSKALAKYTDAAIEMGLNDPGLVQRAMNHTAIKALREQEARETIAAHTIELLAEDPPTAETPAPEDDWMNVFVNYAERASSERMRKHWAAVLAGEIRKPGSFSLAALQIMSIMDSEFAQCVQRASGWLVGGKVPLVAGKTHGEDYHVILRLVDCGILANDGSTKIDAGVVSIYQMGNWELETTPLQDIMFPCARLTRAGQEIISLVETHADPAFIEEFSTYLRSRGAAVEYTEVMTNSLE